MGGKVIKKTRYIVLLTAFLMVLIPSLLYITLRSTTVQTYIAQKAANYLSRELEAKVHVGGVNITWFLNIVLEDISILDKKEQPMIYARRMIFDVQRVSFAEKSIVISRLVLEQAALGITRDSQEKDYNFSFLTEYFLSDKETESYGTEKWYFLVRSLELKESGLSYRDFNYPETIKGFDYNHFALAQINFSLQDILYENDTLYTSLTHLSLKESKGLQIKNASTEIKVSPQGSFAHNFILKTLNTNLEINLDFSYNGYEAFDNFADSVSFHVEIKPSVLGLYEVGYFIPDLYGLEDKTNISGIFSGTLSNIKGTDVGFLYGQMSAFKGNFSATGLPDLQETFLNFSVDQFVTSKHDIESFTLPLNQKLPHISLPEEINNLGLVHFAGNFTGFIYDFVAYGQFNTTLGNISTDIAIISNQDFSRFRYRGNLSSHSFNLGKLLNIPNQLGNISLNTRITGSGHNLETLDMEIAGMVNSLEIKGYPYQNMKVAGHFSNKRFSGDLLVNDPNIQMFFAGLMDFQDTIPLLNFSASIDHANLSKLNLYQPDSLFNTYFSTQIQVEGKGSNFDNMEGIVNALGVSIVRVPLDNEDELQTMTFETEAISIENHILEGGQKLIRLTSDFLDAQIEGELHTENLMHSMQHFMAKYAPAYFNNSKNGYTRHMQNIDFAFHLKDTDKFTQFFIPGFQFAPNSFIKGNWNVEASEFILEASSDYILYGTRKAMDIQLNAHTENGYLRMSTTSSKVILSDSIWMDQFQTHGDLYNDSLLFLMHWDNLQPEIKNNGRLEGVARILSPHQTEMLFYPSYAYLNDSLWTLSAESHIMLDSNAININNFFIYKNNEFLKIDGKLSEHPDDKIHIELSNFDIASMGYLLRERKLEFAGIASGKLSFSNIKTTPDVTTNLVIKDFAFNKDHLGDLEIASNWDAHEKAFRVETNVKYYGNVGYNVPLTASGYFYPEREHDNFDLDITIENLKMSIFSRYVEGFASNFRGLASGKLRLDGPLSAPELSGRARLVRTGLKIDYLNTAYTFAHEIEVGKDYFRFDNLVLNDTIGNNANVTGIIRHNNFFDFSIDISMWLDRMIALNTLPTHNALFYGKGFASGLVHVYGPVDNIMLNISAQANRGTQIFLPLDYQGELTESNFITFITPHQQSVVEPAPMFELSGLTMNFDLTITPESEIQIIFDSQIGDIIRSRGTGNLKFEITPQGAFYMYGDYMIDEGDYLFTLQNLINKRFRIQQGGLITWSGNPYDANIDLNAIYRTRTSLADLASSVLQGDTSDVYRRRVPIETVLHLEEKLFNPAISFDIQIPGGDEESREMISRLITTEQEMNRQVFSLLILNRFTPNPTEYNTALGYGVGSTSTELLSNQLSNWLSQISTDFDIGVNYRPGDEISSQEIEVALSTQLFDDRVAIDGNVGVAGNHPANTHRTSNIIGDVNIEVKITPEGRFRIKAFNRSNTFDVLHTNSPYTQGIGVFYRKEFDNLYELFKRARRVPLNDIPDPEEIDTIYPEIEAHDIQALPENY